MKPAQVVGAAATLPNKKKKKLGNAGNTTTKPYNCFALVSVIVCYNLLKK